jgi:hypothetical protein
MISRDASEVLTKSKRKFGFHDFFETGSKGMSVIRSVAVEVVIIASSKGQLD